MEEPVRPYRRERAGHARPGTGGGKPGETDSERKQRISRWVKRYHVANIAALVVLWPALTLPNYFGMQFYWPLLPTVMAMPIAGLFIIWWSYGTVDLFTSPLPDGPNVSLLSLSPLALAWRAYDWQIVDDWIVWAIAFCLSIPVTAVLARITRSAGHSLSIRGPAIFALSVLYVGSMIVLVNVRYDRHTPETIEAKVSSIREGRSTRTRYRPPTKVRLRPWDLQPYGVTFSAYTFNGLAGAAYCDVLVHPGALGLRWLELDSCFEMRR